MLHLFYALLGIAIGGIISFLVMKYSEGNRGRFSRYANASGAMLHDRYQQIMAEYNFWNAVLMSEIEGFGLLLPDRKPMQFFANETLVGQMKRKAGQRLLELDMELYEIKEQQYRLSQFITVEEPVPGGWVKRPTPTAQ